jgi:hypothetical protein
MDDGALKTSGDGGGVLVGGRANAQRCGELASGQTDSRGDSPTWTEVAVDAGGAMAGLGCDC